MKSKVNEEAKPIIAVFLLVAWLATQAAAIAYLHLLVPAA